MVILKVNTLGVPLLFLWSISLSDEGSMVYIAVLFGFITCTLCEWILTELCIEVAESQFLSTQNTRRCMGPKKVVLTRRLHCRFWNGLANWTNNSAVVKYVYLYVLPHNSQVSECYGSTLWPRNLQRWKSLLFIHRKCYQWTIIVDTYNYQSRDINSAQLWAKSSSKWAQLFCLVKKTYSSGRHGPVLLNWAV